MTHPRGRAAGNGGSVALALALAAAPAMAQDDPAATVSEFLDTIVAKDFDGLAGYFCEEFADEAARFDISSLAAGLPEGVDAQALLDAFILGVEVESLETVSQTDTEAVVHVAGTLSMDIDSEAIVPFVESMIEASGLEVDESTVEMFMTIVASEFTPMSESIEGDIELVAGEERPWLICGDLDLDGTTAAGSPAPDISAAPAVEASPAPSAATTE
jgi:hypothetical protein